MKILAIIPARGGSKGIKNKNIIELKGKPLIEYTIKQANKLIENKIINKAIVSTDSDIIAKISVELGIEVPFLRPNEISGDKAKSISFVTHALDFYKKNNVFYDIIIILQPTSPLRTYEDIKNALELLKKYPDKNSVISCYKEDTINDMIMYRKTNDYAVPLNKNHNLGKPRQDFESIYIRNGAIYIVKTDFIYKKQLLFENEPLIYVMSKSKSINIDSAEDLKIVKKML